MTENTFFHNFLNNFHTQNFGKNSSGIQKIVKNWWSKNLEKLVVGPRVTRLHAPCVHSLRFHAPPKNFTRHTRRLTRLRARRGTSATCGFAIGPRGCDDVA